jgi:hypothetical protein
MGRLIATLPNTRAGDIARSTLIARARRSGDFEYLGDLRGRVSADSNQQGFDEQPRSASYLESLPLSFHLLDVHGRYPADEPGVEQALMNDWKGYHSDPQATEGERGFILNVEPAWDMQLLAPPNGMPTLSMDHSAYMTQLNVAAAHAKGNYGKDSRVALIDTGCDGLSIHDFYDLVAPGSHHPGPGSQTDTVGHGTAMATIIQAVSPSCDLTVVRVSDTTTIPLWNLLAGVVVAAIDAQAEIINLSLGMASLGGTCSKCGATALVRSFALEYLLKALRRFATSWYINAQPPTFVAATGNDGNSTGFFAPARYDVCLAVGSVNSSATKSNFSTYGTYAHLNHVMAPGGEEVSKGVAKEYSASDSVEKYYGTSVSTAYTTGLLALFRRDNPTADLLQLATTKVVSVSPAGLCGSGQIIYS